MKECIMCGNLGHRYQDGERCPEKEWADFEEKSRAAKKGWERRRLRMEQGCPRKCRICNGSGTIYRRDSIGRTYKYPCPNAGSWEDNK